MMDLKKVLQEMGHYLVEEHGFRAVSLAGSQKLDQTTAPIVEFLVWLDSTPQAKSVLESMGLGPQSQQPKPNSVPIKQPQQFRIAQ